MRGLGLWLGLGRTAWPSTCGFTHLPLLVFSHFPFLNQILLCSPHRLAHALCADLDHMNPDLRDSLVDWLNYLHDYVGFQGWRFDFVRGYAAKYTAE